MLERATEVLTYKKLSYRGVELHCYHRPGFNRNMVTAWGPPGVWWGKGAAGIGAAAFLLERLVRLTGPYDLCEHGEETGIASMGTWADEVACDFFFTPPTEIAGEKIREHLEWTLAKREVPVSAIFEREWRLQRQSSVGLTGGSLPCADLVAESIGLERAPDLAMGKVCPPEVLKLVADELVKFRPTALIQVGGATADEIARELNGHESDAGIVSVPPLPKGKMVVRDKAAVFPIIPDEIPAVWVLSEALAMGPKPAPAISVQSIGSFSIVVAKLEKGAASLASELGKLRNFVQSNADLLPLAELSLLANFDDFNRLDMYLQELIRAGDAEMNSLRNYDRACAARLLDKWISMVRWRGRV